jgi:hypothetical protein
MSRVKALALAIVVSLVLAGCAQLFEFNLFAGLDSVPTPTAADYTGPGGLDALAEDLDSPATVAALAADPDLVQEILDNLEADYWGDGVTGDTDAQAAILYADLALKTTEGEALVNNTVTALLSGGITGTSTVADILAAIIPPEALASEATFTAMINALLMANDAYEQLGLWVDGPDADGSWDNPLPPGSLPGDVATKALTAYTIRKTVDAVISDLALVGTQAEKEAQAIAELYKVAKGQASAATTVEPDPFPAPFPASGNWLLALLDLAGMPLP